jgi:hypothetical protein
LAHISQRNILTSKSSAEIGHTPISIIAAPHLSQTVVVRVELNRGMEYPANYIDKPNGSTPSFPGHPYSANFMRLMPWRCAGCGTSSDMSR